MGRVRLPLPLCPPWGSSLNPWSVHQGPSGPRCEAELNSPALNDLEAKGWGGPSAAGQRALNAPEVLASSAPPGCRLPLPGGLGSMSHF